MALRYEQTVQLSIPYFPKNPSIENSQLGFLSLANTACGWFWNVTNYTPGSAQRNLIKHLNAMVMAVDDGLVSNPNLEDDPNEFVSITTGEIYDREIFNGLKEIKQKGNAQAEEYVDKVIEKGIIPVIPRNNFYTFQNRSQAVLKKR